MLMKQLKLLAFAVCLLSLAAIASAQSASAVTFTSTTEACNGTTLYAECWEKAANEFDELTGEQTVTVQNVKGVSGVLKGTIGSESIEITCTAIKQGGGTNVMLQPTPLATQAFIEGKLDFEGCSITGNATVKARCTIPTQKETTKLEGIPESETTVDLKPKATTEFIVIPFATKEGQPETCPVAGNRAVTGEQEVDVPSTGQTVITAKAVLVSKLKLAGNAAELSGEIEVTPTGLGDKIALRLA